MSGISSCLALFGTNSATVDAEAWYRLVLSKLDELGTPADTISMKGKRMPSNPQTVSTATAILEKRGFEAAGVIEIFSTVPGYKQLSFGWKSSASMDRDAEVVIFACPEDRLGLESERWRLLVKAHLGLYAAAYGIGYRRDSAKGPTLFAY